MIYTKRLRSISNEWPFWFSPQLLLNQGEAALFLGISRRSLSRWRRLGVGPRYLSPERTEGHVIFYKGFDLLSWRAQQLGEAPPELDLMMRAWWRAMLFVGLPVTGPSTLSPTRPYREIGERRLKGERLYKRARSRLAERERFLRAHGERPD
jgi:hypothetical protein